MSQSLSGGGAIAFSPPWVTHTNSCSILSVDVQAGCLRFATGGADGLVKVWAAAALLDASLESSAPSLRSPLAVCATHEGAVPVVRWCTSGDRKSVV